MDTAQVTLLLRSMAEGDREAEAQVYSILYQELREQAGRLVVGGAQNTLQPTAIVHEAWLKLGAGTDDGWSGRAHFLGVAAKAMRSILVDHVRARRASKRGGTSRRVVLEEAARIYEERAFDLMALDEALERLATYDEGLAKLVELRFFAGLTIAETAEALGVSTPTVERHWRTARSWLATELDGAHDEA